MAFSFKPPGIMKSKQHINAAVFSNGLKSIPRILLFLLLSAPIVSAQISIDLALTDPTCFGYTNGEIQSQVSGGTTPYTYAWSNGTSQPILYSAAAGTYTLTVTDATGATQTATATLDQPDLLTLETEIIAEPGANCGDPQTFTINAIVEGGTAPYDIQWSNGTVGPTATGLTPGDYTINVMDAQGCPKTTKIKLTPPDPLYCKIETQGGDCTPEGAASATVDVTGGVAPYTFLWSTGDVTQTVSDLAPGTYSVTVEDAQGCTTVCSVTIPPNPIVPVCGLDHVNPVCGANGSISVFITNGSAPFVITWTGPVSGEMTTSENPFVISGLPEGDYSVSFTDDNGCGNSCMTTLVDEGVLTFVADPSPEVCEGGNGSIVINVTEGTAPFTISWSGPSSGVMSNLTSPHTISNLVAGSYDVTVTDATGCSNVKNGVAVGEINYDLTVSASFECDLTAAIQGIITLSWEETAGPYDISYTGPTGTITVEDHPDTSLVIADAENGAYSFTVTDASGCDGTTTLEVNCELECTISCEATPTPVNCEEANSGSITVTTTGALGDYIITWTGGGPVTVDAATETFTISGLAEGDYSITVTDTGLDSCISTCSATVIGPDPLLVDLNNIIDKVCDTPGSFDLTYTSGNGPITCTVDPIGTTVTLNMIGDTETVGGLDAGTYIVTSMDSCFSQMDTIVIDSINNLMFTAEAFCDSSQTESIEINITSGTTPFNIEWENISSGATMSITTSETTVVIAPLDAGDYKVSITDAENCMQMTEVEVLCCDTGICTTTSTPDSCGDPCDGTITVGEIDGTSGPYQIVLENVSTAEIVNFDADTLPFTMDGLCAGEYKVTVTNAEICMYICTETVGGPTPLVVDISNIVDKVCEQPGSFDLTYTSGSGPITCSITPGDITVTLDGAGSTETVGGLDAGTYIVTCMDSCFTQMDTITIDSLNNLAFTATASCDSMTFEGSIDISITSGTAPFSVQWTLLPDGMTSEAIPFATNNFTITDLQEGEYELTVTDSLGCESTETVTIACNCTLTCTTTSTPDDCGDPCDGTITVAVDTVCVAPYSVSWTGPSNGSAAEVTFPYLISGLCPGDYTITVTDAVGNETTCSSTVGANFEPLSVSYEINPVECEVPGSIKFTYVSGNGPITCNIMPLDQDVFLEAVDSMQIFGGLSAGTYIITCMDTCFTQVDTLEVPFENNLMLTATASCDSAQVGSIDVSISGGESPFALSWQNLSTLVTDGEMITDNMFTISPIDTGSYRITVSDANGCVRTDTVTVDCCTIACFADSTPDECGDPCDGTITVVVETDCGGPIQY